jgi:cytochrome c biogenesis protein CcmG/thiol:disulfide interchange protein DsbE
MGLVDKPVAPAPEVDAPSETVSTKETRGRPSPWRWPLRVAALSVMVGLFGLLAWATLSAGRGNSLVSRIASGEAPPAPQFTLAVMWPRAETWPVETRRRLADGRVDLDELLGRPVVVNFWASWCIPCRDEAPILNASSRAHAGEVVFLGVDVQDLTSDALAFSREFETPYVSVRDRGNRTYEDYGLTGVPETYYLDRGGRIIAHTPGAISRASLEQGIAQAIGGAP